MSTDAMAPHVAMASAAITLTSPNEDVLLYLKSEYR